LLSGGHALADGGTVTINGKVVPTTCVVNVGSGTTPSATGNVTSAAISLPTISWQQIQASGASYGNTALYISVNSCGTSTNTMAVTVDSSNANINSSGVITTTVSGSSQALMRLLQSDQVTPVTPGTAMAAISISSSGSIPSGGAAQVLYVQWFNGTGAAMSSTIGTASASLTFTVNYT
jgi:type 1 fimbria pilin